MNVSRSACVGLVAVFICAAGVARAADDDILNDLDSPPKPAETQAPSDKGIEEVEAAPAATPSAEKTTTADIAQTPASIDKIKAVPRKRMLKAGRVEVTPFANLSVNDAFYQHFAGSVQAVFYPHDSFGMGIGADYLFAHVKSSNVDTIRQNLTSVPAIFELPSLFAHLSAHWVPIYGKLSLFDNEIVHFDFYMTAGAGIAMVGNRRPPLATLGGGMRYVLNDLLALRFEVRDFMFIDSQEVDGLPRSDVQNYVMVLGGISVFLPPSFEYGAP